MTLPRAQGTRPPKLVKTIALTVRSLDPLARGRTLRWMPQGVQIILLTNTNAGYVSLDLLNPTYILLDSSEEGENTSLNFGSQCVNSATASSS